MDTTAAQVPAATRRARPAGYPVGGVRFDWVCAALAVWVTGGLFIDGWAHNHGFVDNSFFTPWHAILYSGAFSISLFLFANQWRNLAKGYPLSRALPRGYLLSLIGAGLFIAAGGFDFIWHELFGFEVNLETLLSPAHLLLAISGILMLSGPVRAGWARYGAGEAPSWRDLGPALLTLTTCVAVLMFFTQFANASSDNYAAVSASVRSGTTSSYLAQALGIAGILTQIALMMGSTLFAVKQWRLPFGSMMLMIGAPAALMTVFHDRFGLIPFVLAGGLLIDMLLQGIRPTAQRKMRFYLFAFFSPVIFFSVYFLHVHLSGGIAWTLHIWAGAVALSGLVGLLLAFLLVTPLTEPDEQAEEVSSAL